MQKYAKKNGEHTYDVGLGNNTAFYESIGMTLTDVEQGTDGNWYDIGYAPQNKPIDEQIAQLDHQYNSDKAILMSQYTEADIDGDEDLKASVKAELVALREQYDKDYEEIVGGEE